MAGSRFPKDPRVFGRRFARRERMRVPTEEGTHSPWIGWPPERYDLVRVASQPRLNPNVSKGSDSQSLREASSGYGTTDGSAS